MNQVKGILLLICAGAAIVLSLVFYSRRSLIDVQMPLVTKEMVAERQEEIQKKEKRRQNAQQARRRAELEERLISCNVDEDCIIVDKDPCGCLRGPEGVTAINSSLSLEFSRLMEPVFAQATSCPSVASAEKECSASAKAVCQQNICKIAY